MYPRPTWLVPFVTLAALLAPSGAKGLVALTEVLKDPVGAESACPGGACLEWIEVTNLGPDTLTADNLFVTDGVTIDSVVPWPKALPDAPAVMAGRSSLPPGRVAVIVDPQYTDAPRQDRYIFADSTILWTVDHTSIAGGLSRDKGLLLYRGTRERIEDSLAAALDPGQAAALGQRLTHRSPASAAEGSSLVPRQVLFDGTDWIPNPHTTDPGSWPVLEHGRIVEHRLGFVSPRDAAVPCTVVVHHVKGVPPDGTGWRLRRADNHFTVTRGAVDTDTTPALFVTPVPKDTVRYQLVLHDRGPALVRDIDLSVVWLPASPLAITELCPRATGDVPEWIEITNTSAIPIDLCGWRLGTPEAADTIAVGPLSIGPGEYLVLTGNRNLFRKTYAVGVRVVEPAHWQALDNYRDTLHLWSPLDSVAAETIRYDHAWFDRWDHEPLARVDVARGGTDRNAWAVAAKPSPGQPNGPVYWRAVAAPSLTIGPTPFTPNGDGRDELLAVRLRLPASGKATLSIYGFNGDRLYRFASPPAEKQYWDGMSDGNRPAPAGPFFVVAQITDGGDTQVLRAKGILWR